MSDPGMFTGFRMTGACESAKIDHIQIIAVYPKIRNGLNYICRIGFERVCFIERHSPTEEAAIECSPSFWVA